LGALDVERHGHHERCVSDARRQVAVDLAAVMLAELDQVALDAHDPRFG
jgi:hypothetical protein